MPSSEYHATNKLNWLRGTTFPAALSNVYLSHHTADPGSSGVNSDVSTALAGGRTTLATSSLSVPAVSAGGGFQVSNTATVTASSSAASAQTVTHLGIWDAPTGGNFITYGLLSPAAVVATGDVYRFATGQIVILEL
jgi:hypothetical protein